MDRINASNECFRFYLIVLMIFFSEPIDQLKYIWNSKQLITEGEAAIPMEMTQHAFRNQEKTKINYRNN